MDDYFKNWYTAALPKFRQVQEIYPAHPYVARYISESQQAISAGKDHTPKPVWPWLLIGAGALLSLTLITVAVRALVRQRRPPAAAYPSGGWHQPGGWQQPPPGGWQQGQGQGQQPPPPPWQR